MLASRMRSFKLSRCFLGILCKKKSLNASDWEKRVLFAIFLYPYSFLYYILIRGLAESDTLCQPLLFQDSGKGNVIEVY